MDDRAITWVFSIYVLFNLISTPLMAKLSDIFGRRSIYVLDVTIFAPGSLLVALSPCFAMLLIGRADPGIGRGGIFPVASAVIGDTFPPEKRGSALGLIGAVFGIAFIIGPILGGILLLFGWQWLFVVNLPIAAVVIVMSLRILPTSSSGAAQSLRLAGHAHAGRAVGFTGLWHQPDRHQAFRCQYCHACRVGVPVDHDCAAPGLLAHRAQGTRSHLCI